MAERYDILIRVRPAGQDGPSIEIAAQDVLRSDIMKPDYGRGGIASLVCQLERMAADMASASRKDHDECSTR